MATRFEDVLTALCENVTPLQETGYQKIFTVGNLREGKLALDILTSYGFEAKAYNDAAGAKLYITRPAMDAKTLEYTLQMALTYAKSLKIIKSSVETLCSDTVFADKPLDYAITMANAYQQGKQIVIHLTPAVSNNTEPALAPAAPPSSAAEVAKPTESLSSAPPTPKRRKVSDQDIKEFSAGPALSKNNLPDRKSAAKLDPDEADTLKKQLTLYLKGNMAKASYYVLKVVVGVCLILSFLVFLRGFLCPDFAVAVKKNPPWYCKQDRDEKDK